MKHVINILKNQEGGQQKKQVWIFRWLFQDHFWGVTMTTIFPIQDNEHSIAWTLTLTAQACAQWCSWQRCGDRRYGRDLPTGIVQISPGGAMHASHAVFQCYLVGICQFVAPFKPMSGGRSYCVAELRERQESRRSKRVQVLGVFCLGKCSKEGSLT